MSNKMRSGGKSPSAAQNKDETKIKSRSKAANEISSDSLVADLLKDLRSSEKPFSMVEIVKEVKKSKKHSKDKKHHKKKKSKKSKSKHRRARSRSRSISDSDRSVSRHREKKSRKRKRSRSRSRASNSKSRLHNEVPMEKVTIKENAIQFDRVSEDEDDLPMGAEYSSIKQPTREPAIKEEKLDLSLLPSDVPPPASTIRIKEAFPLSKEQKKSESPPVKTESELLKKAVEEKGKLDFIPRNLKISIGKLTLPSAATLSLDKGSEPETNGNSIKKEEPDPDAISDTSLDENIKKEISIDIKIKEDPDSGTNTPNSKDLFMKRKSKTETKTRRRSRSLSKSRSRSTSKHSSSSRATDEIIKSKVRDRALGLSDQHHKSRHGRRYRDRRSRSKSRKRSRTRSRSRDRPTKRRSRTRSKTYSRSRSRSRDRRRSRSNDRARYGNRDRKWNRSRSRSRDRFGKHKLARDKRGNIDKKKLLEIAKKKSKQLQQMGLMSSTGQLADSGKSFDQIVEYCQRLSKREEKEARREKGETVSSDSDMENFSVKHPFDVKPAGPITINITNAIPIPIRSAQERIMDEAQLRICFPVSSGAIHKDNTEWQPVDKDPVPTLCTDKVKKQTAITSLQVEEAKKKGVEIPAPVPILPPPPMPPIFELPNPPCPPSFGNASSSSSSSMLLPPPPLPPMIMQAPPEKLIMQEPDKEIKAPKDVAKVVAKRVAASRRLENDPNDYEARRELKDLDEQMAAWATRGNLPGKYTGSTGVRTLSADELQPNDPRYHAWVKKTFNDAKLFPLPISGAFVLSIYPFLESVFRIPSTNPRTIPLLQDQFKISRPVRSGVGMKLMQKMGWAPGEGLGKDKLGSLEPLQLDVKHDRRGLSNIEEMKPKSKKPMLIDTRIPPPCLTNPVTIGAMALSSMVADLGGRNPVSLLMELCAKRKWLAPAFTCHEVGAVPPKMFRWEVVVNDIEYAPSTTSTTKKAAKALACQVVLQSLGLIKRDPSLPMIR